MGQFSKFPRIEKRDLGPADDDGFRTLDHAQRAADRFGNRGDARRHLLNGASAPVDGFTPIVAQVEQKFGGARQYRSEGEVFVMGDHLPVAPGQDAQQAQAHLENALKQTLEGFVTDSPCQGILHGDGGRRVCASIQHRNLVEHDHRLDDSQDIELSLITQLAKMDATIQQN